MKCCAKLIGNLCAVFSKYLANPPQCKNTATSLIVLIQCLESIRLLLQVYKTNWYIIIIWTVLMYSNILKT